MLSNLNKISILDCSLRDGGYYTNWDFEENLVNEYLKSMNELPVDIIEIGYRSPVKENYAGAHFYLPDFIIERIKRQTNKDLAIILNEKDVRAGDVEELLKICEGKISIIRLAVAPVNFDRGINLAAKIKELGFKVAFNLMYASKWLPQFPDQSQFKSLNEFCDYFYVVDSYGALFPEDVKRIFTYLKSELNISLGFHGHNNLEMALGNSLEAIKGGAEIIDVTIDGMGRGAGNLKTELLLGVLHKKQGLNVNFDSLHQIRSLFIKLKAKYDWGTNLAYIVSGVYSLPQNEVKNQINKRYYSLNNIVQKVSEEDFSRAKNNSEPRNFKAPVDASEVLLVGGGESTIQHKGAILEFLKNKPHFPIIFASSKNVDVFRKLENPQYHVIPGNELKRLKSILAKEELKERVLIIPTNFENHDSLESLKFFELPVREYNFPDSVTEYCLKLAQMFNPDKIYLSGYDGYGNVFNKSQQELFEENEMIFKIYQKQNFKIIALTPSEYDIDKTSIYSLLQ